jgi:hypothetical protein
LNSLILLAIGPARGEDTRSQGNLPQWFAFLLVLAFASTLAAQGLADSATLGSLPGTKTLDWPEDDLSARMMDGAHQFVERKDSSLSAACCCSTLGRLTSGGRVEMIDADRMGAVRKRSRWIGADG